MAGGRQLLGGPGPPRWAARASGDAHVPPPSCPTTTGQAPVRQRVKSPRITGRSRSCKEGEAAPRPVNPSLLLLWEAGEDYGPLSSQGGSQSAPRRWAHVGRSALPAGGERRATRGSGAGGGGGGGQRGRAAGGSPDGDGSPGGAALRFSSPPSLLLPARCAPLPAPGRPLPGPLRSRRGGRGGGRAEAGLAAARRAAHTRTHTSLHVIKWLEICF